MKILFILIVFLIAACVSGAQGNEPFISFDNPSMTREERLIKLQVLKHKTSTNKQYIFNDVDSIADREFSQAVLKLSAKQEAKLYNLNRE